MHMFRIFPAQQGPLEMMMYEFLIREYESERAFHKGASRSTQSERIVSSDTAGVSVE
jgi:hypothetical protein